MRVKISPIGIVKNNILDRHYIDAKEIISELHINPRYRRGLDGIEAFSHIIVIFWLDKISPGGRKVLKVHPRHDFSLPLTGVFSTRSPARPNPIGITTVKLIEKKSNTLIVAGLDAIDGTPVLDIKPYLPEKIDPAELMMPDWINKLRS